MGHTVLLLYHGAGRGGQWGRRLHGMTSLFTHHEEVQVASGFGCSRAHERERKKQGEEKKNFSSSVVRPGEEEEETVPPKNDTVSFSPFFK